jgi:hypothetical protein
MEENLEDEICEDEESEDMDEEEEKETFEEQACPSKSVFYNNGIEQNLT